MVYFTYMFMHADFFHILFNMLWLLLVWQTFLIFFSSKHLRGTLYIGEDFWEDFLYRILQHLPLFS